MQKSHVCTVVFTTAFAGLLAGAALIAPGCGDGGAQAPQTQPRDSARSAPAYEPNAAAPAPRAPIDPAPGASEHDGAVATFLGLRVRIPDGWSQRPPQSAMHQSMFHVPGVEGAGDAQVVVFGNIGGSNEANIVRWEGQFRSPDGGDVRADVRTLEAGDLPVTIAELEGEYRGMGMAYTPNQRFIAAIIEIPGGMPVFIRFVGDDATVTAHRDAFIAMIKGIEWLGN